MINAHRHKNITWVDVQNPSQEDVAILLRDYKIHDLVAKELMEPSARSKVDPYPSHIYLILHFPIYKENLKETKTQEIDFVIGKDFLITTTYNDIPALNSFRENFENSLHTEKDTHMHHAGLVFYYMLRHLYQSLDNEIDEIDADIAAIEHRVFSGEQKEMVEHIAFAARSILDFKTSLKNHKGILDSLELVSKSFFGKEFIYYTRSINGEYTKIWDEVASTRDVIKDLQETNDNLLNTKTNETMKNLTIMAFITFPLTLVASIFGMNTINMPIIGHDMDFWIVFAIMTAGVAFMVVWFKYKKWL